MPQLSHIKKLQKQSFHKLIIGAALKDFKSIEEYAYLFSHAGADVIDISAFPHSVVSAKKGIAKALEENPSLTEPLIMVSVNIGEDPHFRRIELDTEACTECLACVPSCPSEAFSAITSQVESKEQDLDCFANARNDVHNNACDNAHNDVRFNYNIDLCFGCSNCLPFCPEKALSFKAWNSFDTNSILELIELGSSAIEIHLNKDLNAFRAFYKNLPAKFTLESFCIGSQTAQETDLKEAVDVIIESVYNKQDSDFSFIIQTDGIPISGARDLKIQDKDQFSINKAKLVLDYLKNQYPEFKNQIFVQLAGGTNEYSLEKALEQSVPVSGVAIGSYARKKIKEVKELKQALSIAKDMVR